MKKPTIHYLKTWPEYFEEVFQGNKKFEIRKNDRDFHVNDILILEEFDPKDRLGYTGRLVSKTVTYILYGPFFGVEDGFCIMSI